MSHNIEEILNQLRALTAEPEPQAPAEDSEEGEGEEAVDAGNVEVVEETPSIDAVRDIAKALGQDQALADELLASDMVEAKWLGLCVADPAEQNLKSLQALAKGAKDSESIELLAALVAQTEAKFEAIDKFVTSKDSNVKALGFASIASTILDDPDQRTEAMEDWLVKISEGAEDDNEEVASAISAALLEIGKVDQYWNDAAIVLACELQAEGPIAAELGTELEETLTRMGTVVDRRASGGNKGGRNQNKRRNNNNNKNRNNNRRGRGQQGQNNASGSGDGKKPARRNGRNKRRSRAPAP